MLALKELEGYTQVESEVEQGPNSVMTPTSDVMTVETSLVDLEFGFKVIKSTQKVRSLSLFLLPLPMTACICDSADKIQINALKIALVLLIFL